VLRKKKNPCDSALRKPSHVVSFLSLKIRRIVCNELKIYLKKDMVTSPTDSVGRKNDDKMVNSGNKCQVYFVLREL